MVTVRIGDIFESAAQTLVNTVNTVGVMGKGIALEFRKRFPDMYEDYQRRCEGGEVKLGRPYLYKRLVKPWIVNFPTKEHWRSVSRLSDIVEGLRYLKHHHKAWGITSLAVPPLGCGQGQLEWRVVGPTLFRHLSELDIPVDVFAPFGTPSPELDASFLAGAPREAVDVPAPRLQPAWLALVRIVDCIQHEKHHWPVGRVSFQKLAYFATVAGLPTGLQFGRGSYGPFAEELKPMIAKLVNNGVLAEEQLGRMFAVRPGPTYRDAVEAFRGDLEPWQPIMERVCDLFLRMRTQDAEVAATVHFAANQLHEKRDQPPSELEVFDEVKRWKQRRKPPIGENEIAEAIRALNALDWIHAAPSPELPVEDPLAVAD